MIRAERKRNKW